MNKDIIQLVGCNNYLGVGEEGLASNLKALKNQFNDLDFIEVNETIIEEETDSKLRNFQSVLKTNIDLADTCQKVLTEKRIPLNILGDHAASIGTVSASSQSTDNLGVLWVDAHSDINTPDTTPSGNIHGMTNASTLNLFESDLSNILFNGQKVKPENLAMIGLRDVDPGEKKIIEDLNIEVYTYEDVQKLGLEFILDKLVTKFSKVSKLHLSIDMDSMDPTIVKAVSVPVESGFKPSDVSTIIDVLTSNVDICAIDIVEYNPEYDQNNESALILKKLIDQIKTIYNKQ